MVTGFLTWAKLLLDLQDFVDEATVSFDWLLWSQEAIGNVDIGKAPPPSPMSPEAYQEALNRTRDRISALPIPTFDARLPNSNVVPKTSFDATRSEIRSRINDLLSCVSEATDAKNAINYFSMLDEALNRQIEMLQRLALTMWDLAKKFPVQVLINTLAFQALDVEYSYIPFVDETQDHLRAKQEAAIDSYRARLTMILKSAYNINNILTVEAVDLKSARERLEKLDAEVLQLQKVVIEADADRETKSKEVNQLKTIRQAAEMDLAEGEEGLDTARQMVGQLENRIKKVVAAIKVPYECPVSGYNWVNCIEKNHLEYKKAYSENLVNLRKQLKQLQEDLDDARETENSIEHDLVKVRNTLANLETQLVSAEESLEVAEDRLQQVQNDLIAKAKFTVQEKHKLRADIFAAENTSDQYQVNALITQLGDAS